MKKLITLALAGTFAAAVPAFADSPTETTQDIQADLSAIQKDNAALKRDQDKLAQDRGAKASDKANGNYGKQAADSVAIGADKTEIQEKVAEKKADRKILEHHKKDLNEETANTPDNDNDLAPASGSRQ